MANIPNDEIWYTTWCNKLLDIENLDLNVEILSNTYSNGKGIIKFTGNLTSISGFSSRILKTIELPNTVTSLGSNAFNGCSNLTSITIPNTVTSIGSSAFSGCSGLTSITIPNTVTSIGSSAFSGCSGLTSITIPNTVTSIGSFAFSYCTGLTSITIPNTVTRIEQSTFYDCRGLTSVTIPNTVTRIGDSAFYDCTSLTSITIPNTVTSIGILAFRNVRNVNYNGSATGSPWEAKCVNGYVEDGLVYTDNTKTTLVSIDASLTSVTIPNTVTSIGSSTFQSCWRLTSVTIPDSVISIGTYAFCECRGLTSITIPNSVTTIGESAFSYCINLTSVTIPNTVTSIGNNAFYNCSSLTSVTIGNSVTSIGSSAFYNCMALTSVTIPDSVTSIGDSTFRGCTGLTSVTIPNTMTSIGNHAFYDCNSLTSITIPNSVTSIGSSTFQNCIGLTSLTIPDSVTSIGSNAFYAVRNVNYNGSATGSTWGAKCVNGYVEDGLVYTDNTKTTLVYVDTSLTSIEIPNTVTSIGNNAFYNCTNLTSITIPNTVTSIGNSAFYNCKALTSVTIGNSVTSIGSNAFYNCKGLTSVTIPDSVTSIGEYAFYGCNSLTSITIPNTVTSIGNSAFNGCNSLTSITIPNTMTSIGNYVFRECTSLTSVTIPNTVTSIGEYAFYGCTGLTSLTIPDSVTSIGSNAFNDVRNVNYNGSATGSPWGAKCVNGYVEDGLVYADNTKTTLVSVDASLTSVTIPNTVTSIGNRAFRNCVNLTSVTIPNTVTSIGEYAFYGCKGLTSIEIPNTITSIGRSSFAYCTGLTSVTIPDSVTSIDRSAFEGCIGLTSITIPDSVTSIGSYAFYNVRNVNYNGSATGSPWEAKCVNGYIEDGLVYADDTKTHLIAADISLTSIIIPDTVTMVGNEYDYDGVFSLNDNLQSIVIPKSGLIDTYAFSQKVFIESESPLSSITILDQNPNDTYFYDLYVDNIYVPQNCLKLYELLYKDTEFMSSKLRAIPLNIRFRKKEYNESEDNESGVIIFDESKRTIYLDGIDYTQNVIDASKLSGEIPSECYKDSTLSGVAYCSTAAATAAKTATMPGFELVTGQRIFLQTTVKNSATSNVTLSVNGSTPKPIKIGTENPTKSNLPVGWWIANYDGTNWVLTRIYLSDNNTDTKVTQGVSTTEAYRKILLSYTSSTETGATIASTTNTVYEAVDVEVQPSTGKIFSNGFVKNGGTSSQFLKADGSVDENTYSKSNLTQTKNYTSNSAFYTNGSFTYFNSSDYITSISSVNNSYTLVEFDNTSVTTTGTSISIPFNFPTVSGDLIGNENIHYFLLKNISNSNITLTLVPQPSEIISIIGNLTPMTLQANNGIEISIKVMNDNWIVSKSMEMPISVERPNLRNVIYYTSSDENVVTPYRSNDFGANITNNTYENGVGVITFDGNVTKIGWMAFAECSSLTSIEIPNTVTTIKEGAFMGCTSLTSVTIPNSVISIEDNAFEVCNSLTSVTIPDSVTSIPFSAFTGCTNLTSITIGNSVTSIGMKAFQSCSGLTSITIPNSVTSIGQEAFSDCTSMTSVTIGNSVTSIGDGVFNNCSAMTSITSLNTTPPTLANKFVLPFGSNYIIYVPAESVETYKAAQYWSDKASQIQAIQ